MQICWGGGACNWPLKGGARLKEVAPTAGGTVILILGMIFLAVVWVVELAV